MKLIPLTILIAAAALGGCDSASTNTTSPAAPPSAAAAVPAQAVQPSLVAPAPEPSGPIEFKAVRDLKQAPHGGEPQLRGGQEASSADWPASLYTTFDVPGGRAACTAALLGPRVMLTAAHCVPAAGAVTFVYAGHPTSYSAACTRHPKYSAAEKDASADFALCTVTPAFREPVGFIYETVNTSAMDGLLSREIILTGYGCVSSVVADNHADGKYRVGANTIHEISTSPGHLRGAAFYSPVENNNLFTTDDPAKANLCPGDSGGPSFLRTTGSASPYGNRTVIGVNSRVFYRDAARQSFGSSMISSTGGPDFRPWAEGWARDAHVAACGVAGTLPNCRS